MILICNNYLQCARNSQCCSKLCALYKKGMPNICSSIPKIDKTIVSSNYFLKEAPDKQNIRKCLPLNYLVRMVSI